MRYGYAVSASGCGRLHWPAHTTLLSSMGRVVRACTAGREPRCRRMGSTSCCTGGGVRMKEALDPIQRLFGQTLRRDPRPKVCARASRRRRRPRRHRRTHIRLRAALGELLAARNCILSAGEPFCAFQPPCECQIGKDHCTQSTAQNPGARWLCCRSAFKSKRPSPRRWPLASTQRVLDYGCMGAPTVMSFRACAFCVSTLCAFSSRACASGKNVSAFCDLRVPVGQRAQSLQLTELDGEDLAP